MEMDTLSLNKYQHPLVASGKQIQSGRPRPPFIEFFINGSPLSALIDDFYQSKGTILDNWIGVLGTSKNAKVDIIKVKQLLGKTVTDKEIKQVFPSTFTDLELQYETACILEELEDPEILIYCCAECGSRDCGGIAVAISRMDDKVIWTIKEGSRELQFAFNKHLYFNVLNGYMEKL